MRWFLDGDKLRQDRLDNGKIEDLKCRNCEKEGQFIRFINQGKPVYMEYGTMPGDGRRGDGNYRNLFLIDPRVLGLMATTAGVLHPYQLDSILATTDRTPPTLEKNKWNGKDAFIVRFEAKSGPKIKYALWIVPSMDYSVVQSAKESEDGSGTKYASILKCEMEKYGKPGTWFPKSYAAEDVSVGKTLWREKMELSDVTINEPLPANTFKLAGMNIPVGWPIYGSALPDKRKRYKWDGSKIVESDSPKAKDQPKSSSAAPTNGTPRGVLLAGAGGLAIAGTLTLGLFFRKRA